MYALLYLLFLFIVLGHDMTEVGAWDMDQETRTTHRPLFRFRRICTYTGTYTIKMK